MRYFPDPLEKVVYEIAGSDWVPSSLILWQVEKWRKILLGYSLQGRFKPSDDLVWFSLCFMSVPCRLSRFVVSVRSWATRRTHHEDQRPDSFLERIRGPELIEVSTRQSNIRSLLGIREQPGGVNR